MANLACACGNIIPLPGGGVNEYALISRKVFHDMIDAAEDSQMSYDDFFSQFCENEKRAYFCQKCNRLTIEGENGTFTTYCRDDG